MKILYISYFSQPSDKIGAVRPSNMVRWLVEFGHDVTFITANAQAYEVSGSADVHAVQHSRIIRKGQEKLAARANARKNAGVKPHGYFAPKEDGKKRKVFSKDSFYSLRLWLWTRLCQQDWYLRCRRHIRQNLTKDYDVILSCFGPIGCILVGRWARRHGYGKVWVSDLRDPIANTMQSMLERCYSLHMERQTLRMADRIVMVSQGEAEHFKKIATNEAQRQKVTFLENGYEYSGITKAAPADGVLRITYTGQLYGSRSDPSALIKAAVLLKKDMPALNIEIHYAGPHSHGFMEVARRFGGESMVVDHGMLPRDRALSLQEEADILCVLTWNDSQATGHLPGKFWEYLRVGKPILTLSSGAVAGAELSHRVREMNVGFAYEYATADDAGLYEFLKQAAISKQKGEQVSYSPNAQMVLDYRYDNRTHHMEDICRMVLESKGKNEN